MQDEYGLVSVTFRESLEEIERTIKLDKELKQLEKKDPLRRQEKFNRSEILRKALRMYNDAVEKRIQQLKNGHPIREEK